MANLYLGRSEYITKRLTLLRNMEAPTISDATQNYGSQLIEKVFCSCDLQFKEDFGLEPPLKGAVGKDLWSSPSDLMMGKVCLKPPYTNKHAKALTHQGILDIGMKVEKQFWNEVEIEKAKELEEQDRTLRLLCETSKKEAIAEVQKRMMEIFRRQRLELIDEMEDLCKKELWKMEVKFYRDLQDELRDQARYYEEMYQSKTQEEVTKTSESDSVVSDNNYESMIIQLVQEFQEMIQQEKQKGQYELEAQLVNHKRELDCLRHQLECKNVSNTMYAVIMERKRTERERYDTRKRMTQEIHELENLLQSRQDELAKVKTERDEHKKAVEVREKALLEIIREFQKFINYSLKAVPKQAEYLLCAEKLMVFELTEALTKVEVPKYTDDDHDRNYLYDRTPSKSDSTGASLIVRDGHECFKESEISESELSVDEFFPGFYFRDQLFVREDFRDLVSHGVRISPDSLESTRHVQEILRDLILKIGEDDEDSIKDVTIDKKISNAEVSHQLSSVHFTIREKPKPAETPEEEKEKKKAVRDRRSSIKPIIPEEVMRTVDFGHVGEEEKRKTLLAAANSLELIKHELQRPTLTESNEFEITDTKEVKVTETEYEFIEVTEIESDSVIYSEQSATESKLVLDTRDSVIMYKIEKGLTSMPKLKDKEQIPPVQRPRRGSKLLTVQDSLEILRRRSSSKSEQVKVHEYPEAGVLKGMSSSEKEIFQETIHDLGPERTSCAEEQRQALLAFGKFIVHTIEGDNKTVAKKKKVTKSPRIQQKIAPKKIKKVVSAPKKPPQIIVGKVVPVSNVIVGDPTMKFDDQTDEQFSTDRVKSIMNIIKGHPNLIRLFTSVCR